MTNAVQKRFTGIPDKGGRQVIIAVDGSANAKYAFRWYLQHSRMPDDGVTFLHIFEAPSLTAFSLNSLGSVPVEEWNRKLREKLDKVREIEEDYIAEGQAAALNCAFLSKHAEKTGECIIQTAQDMHADLLIMGTRGLGVVSRAFLGSVSDFVIHQGVVPVTVVPNNN
nr:universal stress protein [Hymenolepis microstoma]